MIKMLKVSKTGSEFLKCSKLWAEWSLERERKLSCGEMQDKSRAGQHVSNSKNTQKGMRERILYLYLSICIRGVHPDPLLGF